MAQPTRRERSRTWSARQTTLGEVIDALARLNRQVSRHDAGEAEHPHSRNCVMNLVAVVPETQSFATVEAAARELADHHPLRVIAVRLHPDDRERRLGARVSTHAHSTGTRRAVQHEHVVMDVAGGLAAQLRALVEPLLVPDVLTIVWWEGTPPLDGPDFDALTALGHLLVVDSARFAGRPETLDGLARLASAGRPGVADLDWGRARGWREVLAQVFSPGERRDFLAGIRHLRLGYASGEGASLVPSSLLTGWLTSQVRLRRLELAFEEVNTAGLKPGAVRRLDLVASAGGRPLQLAIDRRRRHLHVQLRIDGLDPVSQVVPVGAPTVAELLVWQTSAGRRDAVYAHALIEAASMLASRS